MLGVGRSYVKVRGLPYCLAGLFGWNGTKGLKIRIVAHTPAWMRLKKTIANAMVLVLSGVSVMNSGCAGSLHEASVGHAKPVTDWEGFDQTILRDGPFYFGGQPSEAAIRQAPSRGVTAVVNLRPADEMASKVGFDERRLVTEQGMDYVSIPIAGPTFTRGDADRLKEALEKTDGSVLIHCGSSNRVGALWSLYLHEHRGVELEEAISRGRRAGMTNPKMEQRAREMSGDQ